MTARAPFLGSTISLALGLMVLQVKATPKRSRAAKSGLHRLADADRSCRISRHSLAWNRNPREIRMHRRARSAGAQSAIGKKPAVERVFRPTLRHLADRIGARLRAKSLSGRTVTVRVRFAGFRSVTRSVTLDAPISATAILAEIAEELVRTVFALHPDEGSISLLSISVSHLEKDHGGAAGTPAWA
jgi:hypothetical protein